jgi:hypothetical protein
MAKQAVALRLAPEVLEWADGYAEARGVSRQVVLESAVASFMDDCERGVPELRAAARAQSYSGRPEAGVGECPRSRGGHVWETVDGARRCKFCGKPGREHLAEFGAARAAFFSNLKPPMTSGSGKPAGGGK